jgi:RNA recognition motif-containing protein
MANNVYVGGFPYQTTREELIKLFSSCGTVLHAKIIMDRETGRPKGFGFVEMSTEAQAKAAVAKLDGSMVGARKIFVKAGHPQEKRAEGFTPKPTFAPPPGFVERRSGKDRRQAGAQKTFAEKKPWEKKPFGEKKPWEKKPFGEKKPWEKKPSRDKKPWEKMSSGGKKRASK